MYQFNPKSLVRTSQFTLKRLIQLLETTIVYVIICWSSHFLKKSNYHRRVNQTYRTCHCIKNLISKLNMWWKKFKFQISLRFTKRRWINLFYSFLWHWLLCLSNFLYTSNFIFIFLHSHYLSLKVPIWTLPMHLCQMLVCHLRMSRVVKL